MSKNSKNKTEQEVLATLVVETPVNPVEKSRLGFKEIFNSIVTINGIIEQRYFILFSAIAILVSISILDVIGFEGNLISMMTSSKFNFYNFIVYVIVGSAAFEIFSYLRNDKDIENLKKIEIVKTSKLNMKFLYVPYLISFIYILKLSEYMNINILSKMFLSTSIIITFSLLSIIIQKIYSVIDYVVPNNIKNEIKKHLKKMFLFVQKIHNKKKLKKDKNYKAKVGINFNIEKIKVLTSFYFVMGIFFYFQAKLDGVFGNIRCIAYMMAAIGVIFVLTKIIQKILLFIQKCVKFIKK